MVAPPLQWGRDRGELRSFSFTERVMLGLHLAKVSAFRNLLLLCIIILWVSYVSLRTCRLYIVYNYKFYVSTGLVIFFYFVTLLLFIYHQIQQNIKSYIFYEDIIKL